MPGNGQGHAAGGDGRPAAHRRPVGGSDMLHMARRAAEARAEAAGEASSGEGEAQSSELSMFEAMMEAAQEA